MYDKINEEHINLLRKNIISESILELILNKLYCSSEIIKNSCNYFVIKRDHKPPILFKNSANQVDELEISKFINNMENNNCSGIFISQYSEIANKKNYQIEIHKNNILIYLFFDKYISDKISIAVDIIGDLSNKIELVNNILSDDILEEINNEYFVFARKKEYIISNLCEQTEKTI